MTHQSTQDLNHSAHTLFVTQYRAQHSVFSSLAYDYGQFSWWVHGFILIGLIGICIHLSLPFILTIGLTYALCSFLLLNHYHASEKQTTQLQEALERYETELATTVAQLKMVEDGLYTTLETLSEFNQEYGNQVTHFSTQTKNLETRNHRLEHSTTTIEHITTQASQNMVQAKQVLDAAQELICFLNESPNTLDTQHNITTVSENLSSVIKEAHELLNAYDADCTESPTCYLRS